MLGCLWVEDRESQDDLYRLPIENSWKAVRPDIDIELVRVPTPAAARDFLASPKGAGMSLVLVDLYFLREDGTELPLGFNLVEELSKTGRYAVLGLTVSKHGSDHRKMRQAGAHDVIEKEELLEPGTLERHGRLMWDALVRAGLDKELFGMQIEPKKGDIPLAALLATIGEARLAALLAGLLGTVPKRVALERIRGGYSGAVVLHARCVMEHGVPTLPTQREILVKCSRSQSSLEREHRMRSRTHVVPQFVRLLDSGPAHVDDWCAIAADFRTAAETLQSWLTKADVPVVPGEVGTVLRRVFSEEAVGALSRDREPVPGKSPLEVLFEMGTTTPGLALARRAKALVAIEEFLPLCTEAGLVVDSVREFLQHGSVGPLPPTAVPPGAENVFGHGDLHTRNILIDEYGAPFLIDGAHLDWAHPALDWARLASSLVMDCLSSGVVAHRFDRLDQWFQLGEALIRGDSSGLSGDQLGWEEPQRVMDALRVVNEDTAVRPPSPTRWELQLALAVEFARASYRIELSAPKRVLALGLADIAVRHAAEGLREI